VARRAAAFVALSPSDIQDDRGSADLRVPTLPKLLLAGAGDEQPLAAARRLFARCAGWTVLSTLPSEPGAQGTRLLIGPWGGQAREQIAAFLRDYQTVAPRRVSGSAHAGGVVCG
jgi:hypothetical protein